MVNRCSRSPSKRRLDPRSTDACGSARRSHRPPRRARVIEAPVGMAAAAFSADSWRGVTAATPRHGAATPF